MHSGPGGVRFENVRFDPDLTRSTSSRADGRRVRVHGRAVTDGRLAELLRLRVAQLDPCPYCLVLHTRAATRSGIPADVIAQLSGWRESSVFSPAEKAALAYCEGLTRYDIAAFERLHDELGAHFDDLEVAEIAAVTINMNVWTRLKLAEGAVAIADEMEE